MDVNASYPLVCLSPEQGTLVPVATTHVVDADAPDDAEADFRARWWRCFGKLVWLLWLAWNVLRQVRKQVVELRQQAHYWHAQHQRAVRREAKLAEQIHRLQGEIRDLKQRLFGRKSEASASKKPRSKTTTVPPDPNGNSQRRSRGQQPGSAAGQQPGRTLPARPRARPQELLWLRFAVERSPAAMLFSLFQTVELWGLDVAHWLTHYLSACAKAHGQPPPEPHRYLPWNMTAQEREDLSLAKVPPPSPNATTAA